MHVDDLHCQLSVFTASPPNFPGKQVHIVLWERQEDIFHYPPNVQRQAKVILPKTNASVNSSRPTFLCVNLTRPPISLQEPKTVTRQKLELLENLKTHANPDIQDMSDNMPFLPNEQKNLEKSAESENVLDSPNVNFCKISGKHLNEKCMTKVHSVKKKANSDTKSKKYVHQKSEHDLRLERIAQNVTNLKSCTNVKKSLYRNLQNLDNTSDAPLPYLAKVAKSNSKNKLLHGSQNNSLCSSQESSRSNSPLPTNVPVQLSVAEKFVKKMFASNFDDTLPVKNPAKRSAGNFEGYLAMKKRKSERPSEIKPGNKSTTTGMENSVSSLKGVKFGTVSKSNAQIAKTDGKSSNKCSQQSKMTDKHVLVAPLKSVLKSPIKKESKSKRSGHMAQQGMKSHVEVQLNSNISVDTLLKTLCGRLKSKTGTAEGDQEQKLDLTNPSSKESKADKVMTEECNLPHELPMIRANIDVIPDLEHIFGNQVEIPNDGFLQELFDDNVEQSINDPSNDIDFDLMEFGLSL